MSLAHDPQLYTALIGDLVDSRANPDRGKLQADLGVILGRINDKYGDRIASRFTITLGDEFQGLLHPGAPLLSIIFEIEEALFPQKIRFGVGIGSMSTAIDEYRALGSDGPAYHRAREAVTSLKENTRRKGSPKADIRLAAEGGNPLTAELVNSLLSLMTAIKEAWTDRQREVIWAMMKSGGTQAQVAEKLGITQPSVFKNLDRGNYYAYESAFAALEKLLMNPGGFHV